MTDTADPAAGSRRITDRLDSLTGPRGPDPDTTGSTAKTDLSDADLSTAAVSGGGRTGMQVPTADGGTLGITPTDTPTGHASVTPDQANGRYLITAQDRQAPNAYHFGLSMPQGSTARPNRDGGVDVVNPAGQVTQTIAAPWAKDATGAPVRTHFTVAGNTLTQHIDPGPGSVYPILADPAPAGAPAGGAAPGGGAPAAAPAAPAAPAAAPAAAAPGGHPAAPTTAPAQPAPPAAVAHPAVSTPPPAQPAPPAGVAHPAAQTQPAQPAAAARTTPAQPAPAQPRPAPPAGVVHPAVPGQSAQPAGVVHPAVPGQSAQPAGLAHPAVPAQPAQPAGLAHPAVPAQPAQPAQPAGLLHPAAVPGLAAPAVADPATDPVVSGTALGGLHHTDPTPTAPQAQPAAPGRVVQPNQPNASTGVPGLGGFARAHSDTSAAAQDPDLSGTALGGLHHTDPAPGTPATGPNPPGRARPAGQPVPSGVPGLGGFPASPGRAHPGPADPAAPGTTPQTGRVPNPTDPAQQGPTGALGWIGHKGDQGFKAIDDFGAQHFGVGAHPTPDEAQWNDQVEHIPSGMAKLAQDAGTEIWTGSRHFGFQDIDHNLFGGPEAPDSNHPLPQPGQTPQQAYDQAHPLIADAHRAVRPYQQDVGPMLSTHPDFGPAINHYQHDKVGVFNEITNPLLLGGGMLRGGLARTGEAGTESAVPGRPTTPPGKAPNEPTAPAAPPASSGMSNSGPTNSGGGHTANPGEPAGQSSGSGAGATPGGPAHAPAGVPQMSQSGIGARGPPTETTPIQTATGKDTGPGQQPLARSGHTPEGQQATGEPNTDSPATARTPRTADDPATTRPTDSTGPGQQRQLLDHLDSTLPARAGRPVDDLGLNPTQRAALPDSLRDNPDYTYFEDHRGNGYVRRTPPDMGGRVARPADPTMRLGPGSEPHPRDEPGPEATEDTPTGGEPAAPEDGAVPRRGDQVSPVDDPAERTNNGRSMADRAKVAWWDGTEKLGNAAKKLRGSRPEFSDDEPLTARPRPKPVDAADGRSPMSVVGAAGRQVGDAAQRLMRVQEGSSHTDLHNASRMLENIGDELHHVSASLGDARSLTDGAHDDLLGTQRSATSPVSQTGRPPTSIGDVLNEIDDIRGSLPSPTAMRGAARDIQVAGERARFHDDFSIDHNQRGADQLHNAAAQLHEIADNLERAQAHIATGRSRLAGPLAQADTLPRATVGRAASSDYRATFKAANPNVGNVWVHHAVEQQVLRRYPGLFGDAEIHSLENLRGIPAGAINSQIHLGEIRSSWNEFYRSAVNPTREEVLDWATQLDRKFGAFFNPPVL